MDALSSQASRLVGTWRSVLVSDSKHSGYFRITEDLKFFRAEHATLNPKIKTYFVHFIMLVENITATTFTLRFAGKTGGAEYRYFFEGDVLVLSTNGSETKLCWNCYRAAETELPDYFESEYCKAMEKPWN